METEPLVLCGALAIALSIPLNLWRQQRNMLGGLKVYFAAMRLAPSNVSPVAALSDIEPPNGFYFSAAHAGTIDGVALTMLTLKRSESVIVQGVSMQTQTIYIGAYLPDATSDAFLAAWQRKQQARSDDVAHASRPAEGGTLIVWKGAPSRAKVESHVAALLTSLRTAR